MNDPRILWEHGAMPKPVSSGQGGREEYKNRDLKDHEVCPGTGKRRSQRKQHILKGYEKTPGEEKVV